MGLITSPLGLKGMVIPMCKTCIYQRLNDELEWECPKDEICAERCVKGKMKEYQGDVENEKA